MSLEVINRNIRNVARSGAAFNTLVQNTGLLILAHVAEHGDANPAMRLVQAMPSSNRRNMVINWFKAFSPIRLTITKDVTKDKCGLRKVGDKDYTPFNVDGATANAWYELEVPGQGEILPDTLLEVDDNIISLAKRLEKKLEEGLIAEGSIPAVTARAAALRGLTVAAAV